MKRIAIILALWFTFVATIGLTLCDAKGSSGGRSSSSMGRSSSSFSTSKSTGSSFSTSNKAAVSKPSGSGYNTTKTNNAASTSKATTPSSSSVTVNRTYNDYYGGGSSFGGFWTGMMMGSLMHPHTAYAPASYGGVPVAAPLSLMIAYIVIDIILLCLFLWVCWFIYRRVNK